MARDVDDKKTMDLIEPPKRGRGRPAGDTPAMTVAQRQAARRKRMEGERSPLTVELPLSVIDAIDDYVRVMRVSKNVAVERLLRKQLQVKN